MSTGDQHNLKLLINIGPAMTCNPFWNSGMQARQQPIQRGSSF